MAASPVPVLDGTNLVAKEEAILNRHEGVLVLSRNAGAATVPGDAALIVPTMSRSRPTSLDRALTMDGEERASRASTLRASARLGAPEEWFTAQRYLLRATVARR